MNKKLKWLVLSFSVVGMGLSMPSCPGQQAMQMQLDNLQASNLELTKKVQNLNNQVTTLTNEMNQVKQLLPQITNVIQAQKGAIDQLDNAIKELRPKGSKKRGR